MKNQITAILLLLASSLLSQTSQTLEGRFLRYEVGDYQHAVFQGRDGYEYSFWLNAESPSSILEENRGRWFKITYEIQTRNIPEAGGDMEIEMLTGAILLDDPPPKPVHVIPVLLKDQGEPATMKFYGNAFEGEEDVFKIHTLSILFSDGKEQTIADLNTETVISDYFTGIITEDMNFDGWTDFRIQEYRGGVHIPWLYFLFDDENQIFKATSLFDGLSNPVFDRENRRISSFWRSNAITHGQEEYTIENHQLLRLSSDETTYLEEGHYTFESGRLENRIWTQRRGQGWDKTLNQDVDEDGHEDYLSFDLRQQTDGYLCTLTIQAAGGTDLYAIDWTVTNQAFKEETEFETPEEWVSQFSHSTSPFGLQTTTGKLNASQLNQPLLMAESQRLGITSEALIRAILDEQTPRLFRFQALGKEGMLSLVYVPEFKTMVRFSNN